MTILGIFLNSTIRTGANRRYLELMEGLAERGNRVFVIMNSSLEYKPKRFTKIPLAVSYRRKGFPPASFIFSKAVASALPEIRAALASALGDASPPDWIHIHGDMHLAASLVLSRALHAPLFFAFRCNDITRARLIRASGLLSAREYCFSLLYSLINARRECAVARHARLVAFQNSLDRDIYVARAHADRAKTVIIPGNIGLPRCAPEWRDVNKHERLESLVYAGGVSLSKGLFDMLRVLSSVARSVSDPPRLFVLGRGEERELAEALAATERLGITHLVTFAGFVNPPFPYFRDSSLLVYPTLYDAFPDTVLEALHAGCPVIASSVGGLPDILDDPRLLFPSGDVGAVATRIVRMIQEPSYYQDIRKLSRARADLFRFDWAARWHDAMAEHARV